MSALAWSGVTWGISGPFDVIYGLLALADVLGFIVARQMAAGRDGTAAEKLDEQPHDIAYLNGGPELAVLSALSSMRVAGTIVAEGHGQVRAKEQLATSASELERVIHLAAASPIARNRLPTNPIVLTALENTRRRLEDAGLLLSTEQQRRIKRVGQSMWAVNLIGAVWLIVALANGPEVDSLPILVLFGLYILSYVMTGFRMLIISVPKRSRRGTAELKILRTRYNEFAPSMRPNWATYGPAHAGLGVGIFGASAVWASDPAFAADVNAHQAAATTGEVTFGSGCGSDGSGGDAGGRGCGGCGEIRPPRSPTSCDGG